MNNKPLAGVVGITVAIIVIAAMVPAMMDTTDNIKSVGSNDTTNAITYSISADPDLTLSVGSSAINVGDYEVSPTRQTILAACDEWCVFAFNTSAIFVLYDGGYDSLASGTDVVISNGTLEYTKAGNVDVTKDVVGSVIYADNKAPTYVGYVGTTTFKVNSGAPVYFFNNAALNNSGLTPTSISPIAYGKGTPDALEYVCMNVEASASSIEPTAEPTPIDGHLAMSNVYTASVTDSNGTYTNDSATYGTYVPINYDDVTSSDKQIINLIGIIPVMMIIAVLLLAVAMVTRSKM